MKTESLARKFKPAGFEQPEGSRHEYTKPRRELQEAFNEWISGLANTNNCSTEIECENQYRKACKLVESLGKIPYREANSLLTGFEPKTYEQEEAGLFLSACHNQSPEQVIIFDVVFPEIKSLGYKLRKDKTLVNNVNVDCFSGFESLGLLVNNAETGDNFGWRSYGVAVNNGKTPDNFGYDSSGIVISSGDTGGAFGDLSGGIVIALKEPADYGDVEEAKVLKSADVARIPELKNYLEELSEITKAIKDDESAKRFLERYGKKPKEKIELEIKTILRKGGFEV